MHQPEVEHEVYSDACDGRGWALILAPMQLPCPSHPALHLSFKGSGFGCHVAWSVCHADAAGDASIAAGDDQEEFHDAAQQTDGAGRGYLDWPAHACAAIMPRKPCRP